jgi:hypothetical protein
MTPRYFRWLIAALAATAIVRVLVVAPSFLHPNWHATGIVESILHFPAPSGRAPDSPFAFLTLGAAAALFGRRFETIVYANQLLGVVALGLLADLARRIARTPVAAFTVIALGALHPALVRVAASEDAHTLALCLGALALVAVEVYAATRRSAALWLVVAACVLLVHTHQTFYAFVPIIFAFGAARDRKLLRELPFWTAALCAVAVLMLRLAMTASDRGEQSSLLLVPLVVRSARIYASLLRYHPLIDLARFGALGLALVAGAIGLRREHGATTLLVGLAVLFVWSLPFALPTPGIELAFRTPVLALALVVAGAGLAMFRAPTKLVAPILALLAASPLLTRGAALFRWQSADYREYRAIRDALPSLPRSLRLLRLPQHDPSWPVPLQLFERARISVKLVGPHDAALPDASPRIFIAGLSCWAHRLGEGRPEPTSIAELAPLFERIYARTLRPSDEQIRDTIRPECTDLLRGAAPFGAPIDLPVEQDIPFLIYPRPTIPFQIYQLPD